VSDAFDVLCLGRSSIDIYPLQTGIGLDQVQTFGKFLGGSATNVAVATSRLGHRTALVTRTGEDPFGYFVREELQRFGVDPRFVTSVETMQTPVTFCELFPPDNFPLYFYQSDDVPYFKLRAEEIDMDAVSSAGVLWATLTGLAREPSREAHHASWRARGRTPNTVLDLDFRPRFWSSRKDTIREIQRALPRVTVAIGNVEECELATGETNPIAAARALLDTGIELAIVKQGPLGSLAMTRTDTVMVPAVNIETINGLGAGDAFGGAICHGLLNNWPLDQTLRFASAAGAIVASRLECANAMPTADEVDVMMTTGKLPTSSEN
jgi:5-dehydro-2-deoxygluconokinase